MTVRLTGEGEKGERRTPGLLFCSDEEGELSLSSNKRGLRIQEERERLTPEGRW
jgi:hypothetical protein